jgi:catechol 2,3-dioxygenase-like lactoylglutathione lyase family enzyme
VITVLHTLIYAHDADATRAFFRDVLQLPHVDTGGGWLIFKTGPSEIGVHPDRWDAGDEGPAGRTTQAFDVSLACDDLDATMAELAGRGATFAGEVQEQEWGRTVLLEVPGASTMVLYQPTYDPPALMP